MPTPPRPFGGTVHATRCAGPTETIRELVRMLEIAHRHVKNARQLSDENIDTPRLSSTLGLALGAELDAACDNLDSVRAGVDVHAEAHAGACAPTRGSARAQNPEPHACKPDDFVAMPHGTRCRICGSN